MLQAACFALLFSMLSTYSLCDILHSRWFVCSSSRL